MDTNTNTDPSLNPPPKANTPLNPTPTLRSSLKKKLEEKKKDISRMTLDKDMEELSNTFSKTLKVVGKSHGESLEESLLTDSIYKNLEMKMPHWAIPYHEGIPSGEQFFQNEHGNLCLYNCIDNLYQTPLILPMIWYKPSGGWPRYMSFLEIMMELNRYIQFVRNRTYIKFVTLHVLKILTSATGSKLKDNESTEYKLVKWLDDNFSRLKFHNEEEDKKIMKDALEHMLKKRTRPYINKSYVEMLSFVDGDPFVAINDKELKEKVPIEVFTKILHEKEYEQIMSLNKMNEDYYKYLTESMDINIEEREEIKRAFSLEVVIKQQNIIQLYGYFIIDVLTFSDYRNNIDKDDIKKLQEMKNFLTYPEYAGNRPNIKSPESMGVKRSNHIIKLDVHNNDLLDNGSTDLINKIMGLEKEFLDEEVMLQMLEYFCLLKNEDRTTRVASSLQRFQKRLKRHNKAEMSEEEVEAMIMTKTLFFLELPHKEMPMASIRNME